MSHERGEAAGVGVSGAQGTSEGGSAQGSEQGSAEDSAQGVPGHLLTALASDLPDASTEPVVPAGFVAGGGTAGIKSSGGLDLAVMRSLAGPVPVAAVFTSNRLPAAPVRLDQAHLARSAPDGLGRYGWTRGVISTSGCANAATGPEGDTDQLEVARAFAAGIGGEPEDVLCLSTGIIGTRLPVARIATALGEVLPALTDAPDGLRAAAEALRTTDSRAKIATVAVRVPAADGGEATVRVSGIAKGVGMIHPRMATMLAVILTDAAAEPAALHRILSRAVADTWNQLTVDADTSTNDTVFLLASGAAGTASIRGDEEDETFTAVSRAVTAVARSLARQQAADGEGATTLITCQVSGARDAADARAVARAVVTSSLVKAAVHGRDPNWGRIAGAVGNARLPDAPQLELGGLPRDQAAQRGGSPVDLAPARLTIAIAGTTVFAGRPIAFDAAAVSRAMDAEELLLRVDLGLGDGAGEAFGCDLTEQYVVENSAYTT